MGASQLDSGMEISISLGNSSEIWLGNGLWNDLGLVQGLVWEWFEDLFRELFGDWFQEWFGE